LDEDFLKQAKKWPDSTLDFSPYKDLEIISVASKKNTGNNIFNKVEYVKGEIRKINVNKNKNLKELIIPNQELEGILNLGANSELEKLNIANNLLNGLKVHGKFSQKLKGIESKYLQPQNHNKNKIHPVKDVNVVLLDMGGGDDRTKEKRNGERNGWKVDEKPKKKSIKDLYEEKNKEISQLRINLEGKLENDWQLSFLETLLISQEQMVRLEGANPQIIASSERQLQKNKEKLKEKLSEEEIKKICKVKIELIKLEIELEDLQE